MNGAKCLQRLPRQRFDLLRLRYIGLDREHRGAFAGQFRFGVGHGRLVHVGKHNFHPLAGEAAGHRASQAAASSGNDRNPVFELFHADYLAGQGVKPKPIAPKYSLG